MKKKVFGLVFACTIVVSCTGISAMAAATETGQKSTSDTAETTISDHPVNGECRIEQFITFEPDSETNDTFEECQTDHYIFWPDEECRIKQFIFWPDQAGKADKQEEQDIQWIPVTSAAAVHP